MLSSISPLGERARNSRWWLTTAAYLVGSLAGGLALGALAGLLGSAVPEDVRSLPWVLGALALLLVVGLGYDSAPSGRMVPSWRRQVDVNWLDEYRGWVMGLGFGVQLGFGLVTIITSATTYGVVLLAALSGHLGAGLAIGAVFGVVRALPSVFMGRVRDRAALHAVFVQVERNARSARIIARVALGGAAVALLVAARGS